MLNLTLAVALAFVIWLIVDKVRGPQQPKVLYELVAQDDISHQVPDLEVRLMRLVFRIEQGKGLYAVKDYIKLHQEQDQADAYDVITNKGFFLVIGKRFEGKIDNLPEAVKRVLGSWQEATRAGKEGPYVIYRYQPG
jgi:hypothetical protein